MRASVRGALRTTIAVTAAVAMLASCGSVEEEDAADGPTTTAPDGLRENLNLTESDAEGVRGGRITYGLSAETDGWDPTTNRWAASGQQVARALFDTLAAYDVDLEWKPNLAEDFIPNDDFTQWRITLRPDVQFHNGKPLDGEAVATVLNFLKEATLTQQTFAPVASITATGPLEVTLDLEEPWVNFPFAMTTQIGVVPDPDWLAGGDADRPVGTGPFELVEWRRDTSLRVSRNDNYWRGEQYPYLEEVEFRPLPDPSTRASGFDSGQLDIMFMSSGSQISRYREQASEDIVQLVNDPAGETTEVMVMLNGGAEPFDNPLARRAVAMATDQQAVIDVIADGQYAPAVGPFSPSSPWHTPTDYPDTDPDAAAELVEQVRAEGDGTFEVRITTVSEPTASRTAEILAQQWESVGIDVTIDQIEQAEFIGNVVFGGYQAVLWSQFDSPHPLGDSIWWHPEAVAPVGDIGLNFARNENPAIGEALDAARQTTDPAEELEYYQEVQRLLAEDIPYVWLYHSQYSVVAKPELVNIVNYRLPDGSKGIELQSGAHPMWQIWIDD